MLWSLSFLFSHNQEKGKLHIHLLLFSLRCTWTSFFSLFFFVFCFFSPLAWFSASHGPLHQMPVNYPNKSGWILDIYIYISLKIWELSLISSLKGPWLPSLLPLTLFLSLPPSPLCLLQWLCSHISWTMSLPFSWGRWHQPWLLCVCVFFSNYYYYFGSGKWHQLWLHGHGSLYFSPRFFYKFRKEKKGKCWHRPSLSLSLSLYIYIYIHIS